MGKYSTGERPIPSGRDDREPAGHDNAQEHCRGVSLLEVLITVGIIGLLVGISAELYAKALEQSRDSRTANEMRLMERALTDCAATRGHLPDSLAEVGFGNAIDPWGNHYRYLRLDGANKDGKDKARKDRFLVPLNSDYDLYSTGPDGDSEAPLTATASRDDIVRAGNGAFVGVAEEF